MKSSRIQYRRRFGVACLTLAFVLGLVRCSLAAPPTSYLLVPDVPAPGLVSLFVLAALAATLFAITMISDAVFICRRYLSVRPREPVRRTIEGF